MNVTDLTQTQHANGWRAFLSAEPALTEVREERFRQGVKWGEQNPPDGTGGRQDQKNADAARTLTDLRFREGRGTWADILREEFFEALAESDPAALRAELLQVAAVAVAWVEAIDRRPAPESETCCSVGACDFTPEAYDL